jgi:hypothetical protein
MIVSAMIVSAMIVSAMIVSATGRSETKGKGLVSNSMNTSTARFDGII